MTKQRTYLNELYDMEPADINAVAVRLLGRLLNHCTVNMVQNLTGISRTTLYRWLNEDIVLDQMNHRDAAWFIMLYETKPQIQMLLQRAPSRQRLAHRLIAEDEANGNAPTSETG